MNILELDYNEEDHEHKKPTVYEVSNFLHIKSSDRNKEPTNILDGNIINLTSNALKFTKNSNQIAIYLPNNTFKYEDQFVLENVVSDNVTGNFLILYNTITNSDETTSYQIQITYPQNNTSTEYNLINNLYQLKKNNPNYDLQIIITNIQGDASYLTDADKKYIFNTIPLNAINNVIISYNFGTMNYTDASLNTISVNCIEFTIPYQASQNKIGPVEKYFNIKSLNLAGILLKELNANYPLDDNHLRSYQSVTIGPDTSNYVYFNVNNSAIETINGGGNTMKIIKIIDKAASYPFSSNFEINLNKIYTNVSRIAVLSSEIPYTMKTITELNNSLYYKFLSTAETIYNVKLPLGFFDENTILNNLIEQLNNTITSNKTTQYFFTYKLENSFLTINSYKQFILYQPFSDNTTIQTSTLNSSTIKSLNKQIIVTIPYHNLNNGDQITIKNALSYQNIPANILNSTYSVLVKNSSQVIIDIPNFNPDTVEPSVSNGGNNVIVLLPNPIKIVNGLNTIHNLLGYQLNNNYNYILRAQFPIKLYPSYYLELKCYINNTISSLNDVLTKIQFDGNLGSYLYNKHTINILQFNPPIKSVWSLLFQFTYEDGTIVDFTGFDNSFTINIVENYYENKS